MKVEKAEYTVHDGYPFLEMRIDGELAYIVQPDKVLLDMGCVVLSGEGWEDRLPGVEVGEGSAGVQVIPGSTDDVVVMKLAREFWDAINRVGGRKFQEGLVEVPDLSR